MHYCQWSCPSSPLCPRHMPLPSFCSTCVHINKNAAAINTGQQMEGPHIRVPPSVWSCSEKLMLDKWCRGSASDWEETKSLFSCTHSNLIGQIYYIVVNRSYHIVTMGVPVGIDDLIKVLLLSPPPPVFLLSSPSCPAALTVAHQAFEPGRRRTHHDPGCE